MKYFLSDNDNKENQLLPVDEDIEDHFDEDFDEEQDVEEEEPKIDPHKIKPRQMQRQERRAREKDQLNSGRQRPPKSSVTVNEIERYSEIDNPTDQLVERGGEPSRRQQVLDTGELVPYNRKQLVKEYSKMQAYRNAFVAWQAQQEDYVIYQYAGYDREEGLDRWSPTKYQFNPLTMGQFNKLQDLESKLNDLKRAAQNNDKTIKDVYKQVREYERNVWKLKCELYFRMDVEEEFEISSYADVRDMLEAWEWCNAWVPKSRRIKPSDGSGSKDKRENLEKDYDMIT